MSFGPIKVFTVTVDSAGTSTSMFSFPNGIQKAFLEIPTMVSGCDFNLLGSTDGTNFRRVMQELPLTASVQVQTFTIASAATNRIVPIPLAAPFMKVELTTGPVTATSFRIICHY
jgi:hypothetical protein